MEKEVEIGYYEMGDKLELIRKKDPATADFIRTKFAIPQQVVSIENSSVLVVDDLGRRWRLPLGDEAYTSLTGQGANYVFVVRWRPNVIYFPVWVHSMSCLLRMRTVMPKIRPISTHSYRINDYASYRGMLVLTGVNPEEGKIMNMSLFPTMVKAAVWVGVIDDLWKLGKPVGKRWTVERYGSKSEYPVRSVSDRFL